MQPEHKYAHDNPLIQAVKANDDCRRRGFSLYNGSDYGGKKVVLVPNEGPGFEGFQGVDFKAIDSMCRNNGMMWQTSAPRTVCLAEVPGEAQG